MAMQDEPTNSAPSDQAAAAGPSPRLLEFLVCPATKATLEISSDRTELISRPARLAYPIRDGIPLLTRDAARELTDDDLKN